VEEENIFNKLRRTLNRNKSSESVLINDILDIVEEKLEENNKSKEANLKNFFKFIGTAAVVICTVSLLKKD